MELALDPALISPCARARGYDLSPTWPSDWPRIFADTFGDGVRGGENLLGLLVQQQMVVPEMRPRDVPVEVLRFQIEAEHIRQQNVERASDLPNGIRLHASRRVGRTIGAGAHQRADVVWPRHPRQCCICKFICSPDGIMSSFKSAMIHSEPATTRITMSTPNASASTLLVLSGPVVMCRKKTR